MFELVAQAANFIKLASAGVNAMSVTARQATENRQLSDAKATISDR
jgi:hypothetical protein